MDNENEKKLIENMFLDKDEHARKQRFNEAFAKIIAQKESTITIKNESRCMDRY